MKLVWSAFALADRDGIFTRIEADSPRAAIAIDERIAAAARRLLDFPDSGRSGRVADTRELVVTGTPLYRRLRSDGGHDPDSARSTRRPELA